MLWFFQIGEHAEFLVGQRAHGERRAVFGQACHEFCVVHGLYAVVNALDVQHIQGTPHISRWPLLPRMSHEVQAMSVRQSKHVF